MNNELQRMSEFAAPAVMTPREKFEVLQDMAEEVAKSGLFKMTKPQVLTLMLLAEAEGLPPIKAMMRYHIIEGRPSMRADTMQAEFQKAGGRIHWTKSTPTECQAEFWHQSYGKEPFRVNNSLQEFIDSGVAMFYKDGKWQMSANWRRSAAAMLRARAVTAGIRAVLPSVILGIYAEEEMGEVIETTATQQDIHQNLKDKLRATREARAAQAPEQPVIIPEQPAIIPEQAAIIPEQPRNVPPQARSEFRIWVDDLLAEVNKQLPKAMPYQQVGNHVLKVAIGNGLVLEGDLHADGDPKSKRDPDLVRTHMTELWEEGQDWVSDCVNSYVSQKIMEAAKAAEAQEPSLPFSEV